MTDCAEKEDEDEDEDTEEAVVALLEQTGLVVVVAVAKLAAACIADTRLLIKDDVLVEEVPFCSLVEALLADRPDRSVDLLLCNDVETWLEGKFDPFELPMVKPVLFPVV